ncbi:MAG: hypothetical protein H7Y00_16980 [Fimbriimonadaceae bacterium]|nr:hypothetical protein [Chitinophagales bacterium]
MQKEQLKNIISDIQTLQDADIKQLQILTEKYPFFQLPYALIAKKLHTEHSPYFDAALKKAATYSYSREVLFKLIERTPISKKQIAVADDIEEEIIETDNILNIIKDADTKKEIAKTEENLSEELLQENQLMDAEEKIFPEEKIIEEIISTETNIEKELPAEIDENNKAEREEQVFEFNLYELQMLHETKDEPLEQLIKNVTGVAVKEDENTADQKFSENHTFSEWLKIISGDSLGKIVELSEKHRPIRLKSTSHQQAEKEFDEDDAQILAAKSVQMHDTLITETLAIILAKQGKKQKAIEMLEKLRLKYPQKSAYFASKIEEFK